MEKTLRKNMIDLIKYSKTHSIEEIEKQIRENVLSSTGTHFNCHVNQAYYQIEADTYYLKSGEGLSISIVSGGFDRTTNFNSHEGIDIYLNTLKYGRFTIISENEYVGDNERFNDGWHIDEAGNRLLYQGNDILDQQVYIKEDCLKYFSQAEDVADCGIYLYLPSNLKNLKEIMDVVFDTLYSNALEQHKDQERYSQISPYGGLDVIVKPKQQLFLDSLELFAEEQAFVRHAVISFLRDEENLSYLEDEIVKCDKVLYIIDHADDYKDYNHFEREQIFANLILSDHEEEYRDVVKKSNDLLAAIQSNKDLLEETKQRTGSFFQRLMTKRNIMHLEDSINKGLEDYDEIKLLLLDLSADLEKTKERIRMANEAMESFNLKYPFEYVINDNLMDSCREDECFKIGLERMQSEENSFRDKRELYSGYMCHFLIENLDKEIDKSAENQGEVIDEHLVDDEDEELGL